MSKHGVELLQAFEELPPEERQEFAIEVLRRTRAIPFDSGAISDEEIGEAGRALFSYLDEEKDASASR